MAGEEGEEVNIKRNEMTTLSGKTNFLHLDSW